MIDFLEEEHMRREVFTTRRGRYQGRDPSVSDPSYSGESLSVNGPPRNLKSSHTSTFNSKITPPSDEPESNKGQGRGRPKTSTGKKTTHSGTGRGKGRPRKVKAEGSSANESNLGVRLSSNSGVEPLPIMESVLNKIKPKHTKKE
jgi:hypothetical protein